MIKIFHILVLYLFILLKQHIIFTDNVIYQLYIHLVRKIYLIT